MASPSRPGPRGLAWLAVALAALGVGLLAPGVRAPVTLPNPPPGVRLLEPDSPLFDRAQLADPALLVLPPLLSPLTPGEGAVPEATPFPPVPPDFRSPPGGGLRLALGTDEPGTSDSRAEGLPELSQPLLTLGQQVPRALPAARAPVLRAISLDGRWVIERSLEGDEYFKSIQIKDLGYKTLPVLGIGIDAFGLQAPPVLLSVSGNPSQDDVFLQWAGRQPWSTWLPPGGYRVEIGP